MFAVNRISLLRFCKIVSVEEVSTVFVGSLIAWENERRKHFYVRQYLSKRILMTLF